MSERCGAALVGGGPANGGNKDPSVVRGHPFCGFRSVEPAGPFPPFVSGEKWSFCEWRPRLRLALGAAATLS